MITRMYLKYQRSENHTGSRWMNEVKEKKQQLVCIQVSYQTANLGIIIIFSSPAAHSLSQLTWSCSEIDHLGLISGNVKNYFTTYVQMFTTNVQNWTLSTHQSNRRWISSYQHPLWTHEGHTRKCSDLTEHNAPLLQKITGDLLHALSHTHDRTWHNLWWTSWMHWLRQVGDTQVVSKLLTGSKWTRKRAGANHQSCNHRPC